MREGARGSVSRSDQNQRETPSHILVMRVTTML
jgi:hypothetical protein